jgi:hypothetical protein
MSACVVTITSLPGSTIGPLTTWPWMATTHSSTGSTAEPGTLSGGSSEELWVRFGGGGGDGTYYDVPTLVLKALVERADKGKKKFHSGYD